jgi:hypothetical protein
MVMENNFRIASNPKIRLSAGFAPLRERRPVKWSQGQQGRGKASKKPRGGAEGKTIAERGGCFVNY